MDGSDTEPASGAGQQAPPADRTAAAQDPPSRSELDADPRPPTASVGAVDRSAVIGAGLRVTASWAARFLLIGLAVVAAWRLLSWIWIVVLPVLLALLFSSVVWPLVEWARRHRMPSVLAAAVTVLGSLAVIMGLLVLVVGPVISQVADLGVSAGLGIQQLRDWLAGPPLRIDDERIDAVTDALVDRLRSSAEQIAAGVFTGVSTLILGLVTFLLVVVLSFLFLKDGAAFLPWVRRQTGRAAGTHLTELLARVWLTMGRYLRVLALVSFIDAVLIGIGLAILGVPLVMALTVLTFLAGFVPIVGAMTAGAVAALVALVSNGPTTALLVVALVIVVQQIESNALQPLLQGRSLRLHAAVVLLSVTAGATLFGVVGAFLAVPVMAVVATALRYVAEQLALRSGEMHADEVVSVTTEGVRAARLGERAARWFRERSSR